MAMRRDEPESDSRLGRAVRIACAIAISRAVRAIGPSVLMVPPLLSTPRMGTVPRVGRKPYTPHSEAGSRIDPSASLPIAIGTKPAASAAAQPPEDPPG